MYFVNQTYMRYRNELLRIAKKCYVSRNQGPPPDVSDTYG
jgi:hypothetical protein